MQRWFDFLEKGLAIVSPPHFVHDFSRNIFLMFFYMIKKSKQKFKYPE